MQKDEEFAIHQKVSNLFNEESSQKDDQGNGGDKEENQVLHERVEKDEEVGEGSSYLTMYGEHRVKPAIANFPKWLSDYFAWHQSQLQNTNSQTKYLVVTCLRNDRCGDFSDRLRSLPFMLLAAYRTKRVLCIYWTKPFWLGSLLKPPKGGMSSRLRKYCHHARLYRSSKERKNEILATVVEIIFDTKAASSREDCVLMRNFDRFIHKFKMKLA